MSYINSDKMCAYKVCKERSRVQPDTLRQIALLWFGSATISVKRLQMTSRSIIPCQSVLLLPAIT